MKKIQNPLTIIGIFAGIAEVAGTTVLPFVDTELQKIFICYVMGFPLLLVILFFLTLNKNPKVLYAPSDFADEKNFMKLLANADHMLTSTLDANPELKENLKPLEQFIESAAMDSNELGTIINISNSTQDIDDDQIRGFLTIAEKNYRLLREKTVIGKSKDCDIIIFSTTISREHCIIERNIKDEYFLRDMDSSNGTLVNGRKINFGEAIKLSDKDIICMGKVKAVFNQSDTR
ncbi:FHA domain-containing protein [Faecalimonas umbilicata]|nr:FHA domain-containing protein [Faecalimonas umbilicata]